MRIEQYVFQHKSYNIINFYSRNFWYNIIYTIWAINNYKGLTKLTSKHCIETFDQFCMQSKQNKWTHESVWDLLFKSSKQIEHCGSVVEGCPVGSLLTMLIAIDW